MAYRIHQPDRRRRRRRLLLILLTIVLVIAAITYLVTRQTEQRETADFFAAADQATALHEQAAEMLNATLAQLGPLMPRQEVTRRLSEIVATAEEANALLAVEVPPSIGGIYGSLTAASASWVLGTSDLETAILGIMDGEIQTGSEVVIRNALNTLRVGDVGYGLFLSGVSELPEDVTPPEFPTFAYVAPDPEDPFLYDAQNLALKVAAAYSLTPRIDIAVVGMVEPAAVGDRGGIALVPFSDTIGVSGVISNVGNEAAPTVGVELVVLNVDTGETFTLTEQAGEVGAGASTTVSFANLAVTPGGLYQVTLSVTIPQDVHPDNDTWSMTFIWNSES